MKREWHEAKTSAEQGLIIDQDGRTVAVAYDAKDAPLIAAAPKMLEALKSAECPYWEHNAGITKDIEQLRKIVLWYSKWNNEKRIKIDVVMREEAKK